MNAAIAVLGFWLMAKLSHRETLLGAATGLSSLRGLRAAR